MSVQEINPCSYKTAEERTRAIDDVVSIYGFPGLRKSETWGRTNRVASYTAGFDYNSQGAEETTTMISLFDVNGRWEVYGPGLDGGECETFEEGLEFFRKSLVYSRNNYDICA